MEHDESEPLRAVAAGLSNRCCALAERAREEGQLALWMVLQAASESIEDALDMLDEVEADGE